MPDLAKQNPVNLYSAIPLYGLYDMAVPYGERTIERTLLLPNEQKELFEACRMLRFGHISETGVVFNALFSSCKKLFTIAHLEGAAEGTKMKRASQVIVKIRSLLLVCPYSRPEHFCRCQQQLAHGSGYCESQSLCSLL
ncbi:hypothetical protein STEG23_026035, partial [Scotinomys teguina]